MRKQRGLSLIELMISITLGIVLMTGVVQVFLSSKSVFNTQQGISRIQESGRLAVNFVSRDLRMAGFYGCTRATGLKNDLVIAGLHEKFTSPIMGYKTALDLPHGAAVDLGANITPITEDASVLVVRAANPETGFNLSAPNIPTTVFASAPPGTAMVDGCVNGICNDSVVVVSDCIKGRLMKVSGINLAGTTLALDHADLWGGANKANENFTAGVGGGVFRVDTTVYFLAQGASGQPSLWQKINTDTALELIEGVEKMRVTYSREDNTSYVTADQIVGASEWEKVNSVRLELVIRSIDNNVLDEPQTYSFAGAEVVPNDRRMRQIFTTTVNLRNRMAFN